MKSCIGRVAALLAVAATFVVPAAADAHHYTCPGYSDPNCNVGFFYDHQVRPHVETVENLQEAVQDEINDRVDDVLDEAERATCMNYYGSPQLWCVEQYVLGPVYKIYADYLCGYTCPIVNEAYAAVGNAYSLALQAAYDVGCRYFGACD